jgi:hypothetical protein
VYKRVRALEAATNLRLAREDSSQVCFADPRAEAVDMVSKAALAYRLLMSQGTDPCELASVSHNPEHIALTKALSKQLLVFVGQLPELERTIIEKIYFLDRRMADVAAEDVKRSLPRVWRCHQWALGVLRDQMLAWEEGKSVQPGEYEPGDQGDAGESGVKGSPKKRRRKRKGGVVKKGSRA